MKREQLNKHWKEIEAFKNGAEIECRSLSVENDTWDVVAEPQWSLNCEYRVKQKAREWWIMFLDGRVMGVYDKEPNGPLASRWEKVRVCELMEK